VLKKANAVRYPEMTITPFRLSHTNYVDGTNILTKRYQSTIIC
jgi:hypothetical protein